MVLRAGKLSALALFLFSLTVIAPLTVSANNGPVIAQTATTPSNVAAEIVELTNRERAKAGLPPTIHVEYLAHAATGHSQEMLDLNYFSHLSPTPGLVQPKMRIQQSHGWDTRIGENIYRSKGVSAAEVAQRAVAAWVKSPSHYKNLVDPTFNSIGIGIVVSGEEFVITQMFSNQTIVVEKLTSTPTSGGYKLAFQGQVREGSKEGAVFINNSFKEAFKADASGRFAVEAQAPAGAQVSISQKKADNKYSQNLAFPVEAGLQR